MRHCLPTSVKHHEVRLSEQFIRGVEDRSGLLTMSGHDVEEGRLVEFLNSRT